MARTIVLVMAAMVMAQAAAIGEIKLSGETTYGAQIDVPSLVAKEVLSQTLTVAGIADVASASIALSSSGATLDIGEFYASVDVAKAVGLKRAAVAVRGGKLSATDTQGNLSAAGKGFEAVGTLDFLTVKVAAIPVGGLYLAGVKAAKALGPVALYGEAFYLSSQKLSFDAGATPTIGPLVITSRGGARIDLTTTTVAWDASVSAAFKTWATLGATVGGSSAAPLSSLAGTVTLGYSVGKVDFKAYAKATTIPLAFVGADVCAVMNLGAVDLYLGAVVKGGNKWGPAAATTVAPYVKMDLIY